MLLSGLAVLMGVVAAGVIEAQGGIVGAPDEEGRASGGSADQDRLSHIAGEEVDGVHYSAIIEQLLSRGGVSSNRSSLAGLFSAGRSIKKLLSMSGASNNRTSLANLFATGRFLKTLLSRNGVPSNRSSLDGLLSTDRFIRRSPIVETKLKPCPPLFHHLYDLSALTLMLWTPEHAHCKPLFVYYNTTEEAGVGVDPRKLKEIHLLVPREVIREIQTMAHEAGMKDHDHGFFVRENGYRFLVGFMAFGLVAALKYFWRYLAGPSNRCLLASPLTCPFPRFRTWVGRMLPGAPAHRATAAPAGSSLHAHFPSQFHAAAPGGTYAGKVVDHLVVLTPARPGRVAPQDLGAAAP